MPSRSRTAIVSAEAYRRCPAEADMQAALDEWAAIKGGFSWHVRRSDLCPEMVGFWDTTLLVPGLLVCVELKSNGRPFAGRQEEVARMLATVNRVVTGVVRPEPRPLEYSYDEVIDILRRH